MSLNTDTFERCVETLEASLARLQEAPAGSVDYEVFRNAVVKGFELTLEMAGKLLRKSLKAYVATPRFADELTFKDVFRHAARHGLLEPSAVSRWFAYRDNRNSTAHDYGAGFAEETLTLLPGFLADARALETTLRKPSDHAGS